MKPRITDQSLIDLGQARYDEIVGNNDVERDKDGFIILRPRAQRVDQKLASLTTNIDTLEDKLKELRSQQATAKAYQESDEYKEDKKKAKKGKKKKERDKLIQMVFNNADRMAEQGDESTDDTAGDKDSKDGAKKKGKAGKKSGTTLDTTYGQRFSPIVSMLHDTIEDFSRIASEIEDELSSPACRGKTMYRSTQTGNLISAKNSQLSALKELGSIAKTLSDLEYKKDKERQAEEKDTTKALSNLAAKYLKTTDEVGGKKTKGKKDSKKEKEKAKGNFAKASKEMGFSPAEDDDDDDDVERKDSGKTKRNFELAQEFAKALEKRADEISFSPYEKHLDMEGRYKFMVVCDPLDPDHTWDFIAVDVITGKEIKGFKKDYKDLMPKKKQCRMRFDIQKMKCVDLNSSKNYKIVFES